MIEISTHGAGVSPSALEPFLDKEYRDSYLDAYVRSSVAYQIQAIRERMELSQAAFGQLIDKPQNVVSRLEDTEYSGSVKTLIEIAQHLGIGLEIRFRSYPYIIQSDVSSEALKAETIFESYRKASDFSSGRSGVSLPALSNFSAVATSLNATTLFPTHSHQEYIPWPEIPQLGNQPQFYPEYVTTNSVNYTQMGT